MEIAVQGKVQLWVCDGRTQSKAGLRDNTTTPHMELNQKQLS
jgi:hypothetical protein